MAFGLENQNPIFTNQKKPMKATLSKEAALEAASKEFTVVQDGKIIPQNSDEIKNILLPGDFFKSM